MKLYCIIKVTLESQRLAIFFENRLFKRNAAGAANAVVAAQMALAGIQSVIPPDEIIDAMYEIGCQLPACLRETSQAGLATTPTGQKIAEKLGQNQF